MVCEEFINKINEYKAIRKQKQLFGTFGFRGIAGDTITSEHARRVGSALALYLGRGCTIAIGKDPRKSSGMIERGLMEGIVSNSGTALSLGIVTPNALSLEIQRQADAGVMITASHNPPEYNGIKCLNKSGRGFSPEEDLELEKIYFGKNILPVSCGTGRIKSDHSALDRYREHIVDYVKKIYPDLKKLRIVVDGGGGSASFVTPVTLEKMNHEVIRYNCEYDGLFRARNPEPIDSNLTVLKEKVKENRADFGVAHDGDGDRTAFVDEKGRFVQGDVSAAIFADYLLRASNEKHKKIIVTIAFSNLIRDVSKRLDAELIYTPVGEPYLAKAKYECKAQVGLEEHGSVLVEWSREGPMLAGLMAGILSQEDMSLSELIKQYPKYYQIKDARTLPHGSDTGKIIDGIAACLPDDYESYTDMDGVRVDYTDGWFLVRASGTEPKIRVFSEGSTESRAMRLKDMAMKALDDSFKENK